MKALMVAAASAVVLAFAAAAQASPAPAPAPAPAPFAAPQDAAITLTKLNAAQARKLGVPAAFLPGSSGGKGGASPDAMGPCGACINTCWVADGLHTGSNTSTGSYWENASPVWCGNGAWITYLDVGRHWQSVSMWYSADGESGPFIDGGCIGCTSIHFTVYGYFTWHPIVLPASHSTLRLGAWLQAYGSAAYA
jgi:hypothetical protein